MECFAFFIYYFFSLFFVHLRNKEKKRKKCFIQIQLSQNKKKQELKKIFSISSERSQWTWKTFFDFWLQLINWFIILLTVSNLLWHKKKFHPSQYKLINILWNVYYAFMPYFMSFIPSIKFYWAAKKSNKTKIWGCSYRTFTFTNSNFNGSLKKRRE